ncbi:MAG: hexose kinase, partial [Clostridia bacterium]|nr:hexose kinase [Clostridia bacterium]
MIHVLCLNPAIDKLFAIDGFTAGEDYPGRTPRVCIGGKGVNVARVLSQLGARAALYAFLGEGGGEIRREMEARCACLFVPVPGACRTTVNIIDRAAGRETVITESGPRVGEEHVARLMDGLRERVAAGDIVCCSGSLPLGAPEDLYAQVSRLCQEAGALCALDCNAKALPRSLSGARYALGKPNDRELAALLGLPRARETGEVLRRARMLMPPYGALLVSMGANGGLYVSEEGAYGARVPQTPVVSTVGSGDASFAGALCGMDRGLGARAVLRLAMACGVVNAMGEAVGSVEAEAVARMKEKIE